MTAKTLMVMGTHSNAGKSMFVTALCRIFARQGYRVAPFKAQNMALNAGVTVEGHEIGRATIAQAEAAGTTAHVDMNPILLKPEGNSTSQIILNGKPYGHIHAQNWLSLKPMLWTHVVAALDRLRARNDLVIIEGAGSPAEINLKSGDIVNMRVACYANAPVLLVGDIDRGGVFASLVGTMVLLEAQERDLVKAFVINKFRGDISLLGNGLEMLQERAYNTPTLGVIPYLSNIGLAAEDSVSLDTAEKQTFATRNQTITDIVIIRLPHISNFDDFDPLQAESQVQIRYVTAPNKLGNPAAIIIPGTKTTLADLAWLHESGLAQAITDKAQKGIPIVGICGGYQILGQSISDPTGAEAPVGTKANGLALLPLITSFANSKHTVQVQATLQANVGPFASLFGEAIEGYEIHMGRSEITTIINEEVSPLCSIQTDSGQHQDGLITANGQIWGTYLHGIFNNDSFRHTWLRSLNWTGKGHPFNRQSAYTRLADHVEAHLDMSMLEQIVFG